MNEENTTRKKGLIDKIEDFWRTLVVFAVLIFLIIGIICIFKVIFAFTEGDKNDKVSDYLVWSYTQDIVKKNLKSPSSADFPSFSEAFILNVEGDDYRVTSYVDAKNSFGVKVRNDFVVTLTVTKDGYKAGKATIFD